MIFVVQGYRCIINSSKLTIGLIRAGFLFILCWGDTVTYSHYLIQDVMKWATNLLLIVGSPSVIKPKKTTQLLALPLTKRRDRFPGFFLASWKIKRKKTLHRFAHFSLHVNTLIWFEYNLLE